MLCAEKEPAGARIQFEPLIQVLHFRTWRFKQAHKDGLFSDQYVGVLLS